MNAKTATYVGFAVRKGSVVFGLDAIERYRKKIHLILCDETLSENALKKAQSFSSSRNIPLRFVRQLDENIKKNCKILAVCDFNLATAIKDNL